MDNEIYSSDSDESDEDYCPVEEAEPSEGDSDNENIADENTEESTSKKMSKKKNKRQSRNGRSKSNNSPAESPKDEIENSSVLNEEEEKKRADDLWADFLKDADTEVKDNAKPTQSKITVEPSVKNPIKSSMPASPKNKIKVTEIMEFAGEQVKVTKEVDSTCSKSSPNLPLNGSTSRKPSLLPGRSPAMPVKRPAGGGLNSILGKIGKKNKISVLEKTKLDWDSFKSTEGLKEELQTHNKGKDGYLERQDFLERTDHRQFEIEKGMRQTKRSSH